MQNLKNKNTKTYSIQFQLFIFYKPAILTSVHPGIFRGLRVWTLRGIGKKINKKTSADLNNIG